MAVQEKTEIQFVCGSTYWNMGYGQLPGDVLNDAEAMANMCNLGHNMAFLLKAVCREATNPEHIKENLDLFGFELSDEEMAAIRALDRNEKHDWY